MGKYFKLLIQLHNFIALRKDTFSCISRFYMFRTQKLTARDFKAEFVELLMITVAKYERNKNLNPQSRPKCSFALGNRNPFLQKNQSLKSGNVYFTTDLIQIC